MGVPNLIQDQPDHTKRMAEFAMDVIQAANRTLIDVDDPSKGFVMFELDYIPGQLLLTS